MAGSIRKPTAKATRAATPATADTASLDALGDGDDVQAGVNPTTSAPTAAGDDQAVTSAPDTGDPVAPSGGAANDDSDTLENDEGTENSGEPEPCKEHFPTGWTGGDATSVGCEHGQWDR